MGAILGIVGAVLLLLAILDMPLRGNWLLEMLIGDNPVYRMIVRVTTGIAGAVLIVMGLLIQ